MGKNISIITFCVTKWFQRKSHFKRENIINKNKKLQRMHICFPFHHSTCTGKVFKFCLRNQSAVIRLLPFSHFYSSQHVESWRKKTTSCQYNYNLQVPADLFKFSKESITFYAVSVSTKLLCVLNYVWKRKSSSKRLWRYTYLCSFFTHFYARWYQNVIHT